ncbi:hypothetical protein AK972_5929 [Pseudomonas yamanorum]|nr:hypothetical protein AK972_5929 [Pseudomonas yamanorum]
MTRQPVFISVEVDLTDTFKGFVVPLSNVFVCHLRILSEAHFLA